MLSLLKQIIIDWDDTDLEDAHDRMRAIAQLVEQQPDPPPTRAQMITYVRNARNVLARAVELGYFGDQSTDEEDSRDEADMVATDLEHVINTLETPGPMRPMTDNNLRYLLDLLLTGDLDALADWADYHREYLTAAREYYRETTNRASDGVRPLANSDAARRFALADVVGVASMTYHRNADGERVDENSDAVEYAPASASDVVEALNLWEAQHAETLAAIKNK